MTQNNPSVTTSRSAAFALARWSVIGVLAVCLPSISEVRAQTVCSGPLCATCYKPQPGLICCDSPLGHTCEPDINYHAPTNRNPTIRRTEPFVSRRPLQRPTTPKPGPGAAPPVVARPAPGAPPTLTPPALTPPVQTNPSAQPPQQFDPTLAQQIKKLNCPKGFTKVDDTFYGGTRCALPRAAAAEAPPVEPAQAAPKPPPDDSATNNRNGKFAGAFFRQLQKDWTANNGRPPSSKEIEDAAQAAGKGFD